MKQQLTEVGRLGKTHGLRGEIRLSVQDAYADLLLDQPVLFVRVGGQDLPYFVATLRGGGNWLIKFEDINDKETAAVLHGATISLPTKLIQTAAAEDEREVIPYLTWVGYTIRDAEHGHLGQIEAVIDLTQHYLARLRYQHREVYIPLHNDLIQQVDAARQQIDMILPEGLLDL